MPAFTKIPSWLQVYTKHICWKVKDGEPNVYLTFDDGPHPLATPLILDILKEHQVKAVFFCVGKNVQQYPEIFNRILNEGHLVGNHSYTHHNGWAMPVDQYVDDVNKAEKLIISNFFRPPYGRITPFQFKVLKGKFKIVMWDILSKDYDLDISDDEVITNATDYLSGGSIIVMHDNENTQERISRILPPIINIIKARGWNFKLIPTD